MPIPDPLFSADSLLEMMCRHSFSFELYHHPPVFTVGEAHAISNDIPGVHTRNLFLRDKKEQMALLTLPHDIKVDLKKLSDLLGYGRFSFGSPERLWTYLGVKPGSVTPLSILNDTNRQVRLFLEKSMMEQDLFNFHPLDNSMTISLSPSTLMEILAVYHIQPTLVDLSSVQPD